MFLHTMFTVAAGNGLEVGADASATFEPTMMDVFASVVNVVLGELVAALCARAYTSRSAFSRSISDVDST